MRDLVIETSDLTYYYGARAAVDRVQLSVPRGKVYGLLGRNGAGKSTTIRMLLGFQTPTRGTATVLGHSCTALPPEARARIGYLPEGHPLPGWMRVRECCRYQASFYPSWNQEVLKAIVDHFQLSSTARIKNLSRGERAGLSLALTLAPEPELIILDDPAMGLDPVARRSLLESMVYVTRQQDHTILFSSHLLSDVERVADWIAVLDHGILRASCSVEKFRASVRQFVLEFDSAPPALPPITGLLGCFRTDRELRITVANYSADTEAALAALGAARIEPIALNLEDAFIQYLGDHQEKTFFLDRAGAAS